MGGNIGISDCADAIRNAAETVWPNIRWLTCFPHISRKVRENEGKRISCEENVQVILEHIDYLHLCESEEHFDFLADLLCAYWSEELGETQFVDWFKPQYLSSRWKCCVKK